MLGLAVSLWPATAPRPIPSATNAPPAVGSSSVRPAVGATDPTLSLPAGVIGVDLAAIPDRLLNDPPAARLRLAVPIRGTFGIASVDAPSEIAWTEAGYWYWMRSKDLTIAQLIDLAGALH
ncbi:MAG TPA: hypothetical protein VGA16_05650 [Candidatus Limnocylindria bacterium]